MLQRMDDKDYPLTENDYTEINHNANTTIMNLLIGYNTLAKLLNTEQLNVASQKEQRLDERIRRFEQKQQDALTTLEIMKKELQEGEYSYWDKEKLTDEIYELTIAATAEFNNNDSDDQSQDRSEDELCIIALMDKCTDVILKMLDSPHVKINVENSLGMTALDYAYAAVKTLEPGNSAVNENLNRCFNRMRDLGALTSDKKNHRAVICCK